MSVLDLVLLLFVHVPLFIVAAFVYVIFFIAPILALAIRLSSPIWKKIEKI